MLPKIFSNIIIPCFIWVLISLLNFISSLYSGIDISKIDLSRLKRKKHKKVRRIIYIIRNNYLLFVGTSFFSAFLNLGLSKITFEKINLNFQEELIFIFFFIFSTEIFVRYLAELNFSKKLVLNSFFLNVTFFFTWTISSLLSWLIKEKKLSSYRETDLIRLINNLEAENVLEASEVKLVHSALNFDEKEVSSCFKPRKKIIFLSLKMNFKEVLQIYFKYHFTRYPVLSEENKLEGIFNFKLLTLKVKDLFWKQKKDYYWQTFINKKIIYLPLNTKLSKAFEILQSSRSHFAFVLDNKNKLVGIITLEDILETLVGDIKDESEISKIS